MKIFPHEKRLRNGIRQYNMLEMLLLRAPTAVKKPDCRENSELITTY